MKWKLRAAVDYRVRFQEGVVVAILSEAYVLLFNEDFKWHYVEKFDQVLLQDVFLVSVHGYDQLFPHLPLVLVKVLLELRVCHVESLTELICLPERGHACHLMDLRGEHVDCF